MNLEETVTRQSKVIAQQLVEAARGEGTEADFRHEVARILETAAAEAGVALTSRDEYSVARGRVDSVYNRLILEYKRPGVLRDDNAAKVNASVIKQVKDYILDVGTREKREAHRLAGVALDGHYFIFVRRVGEGWSVDDPQPVTTATTERFLRLLYALSAGRALIPENLIEDFGPKQHYAGQAVRALYYAFHASRDPLVVKLYEQWRVFFSEATDYKEWANSIVGKPEFRKFVASLWHKDEIRKLEAGPVFFVLHTYYALLIKLIASLAAARFAGGSPLDFQKLAGRTGEALRDACRDLEGGGLFKQYGIRNFLEGDFFGWYLNAWNEDVETAVSGLLQRLKEYDPGALELAPENARDLLKKLYHYLLPREIRHDLGEYYTPDWLAERLLVQTFGSADLGNPRKRVLDPACGSGTFLVILIKHIRKRAEQNKQKPAETLRFILSNVVGFDLNPLAVIAARTNFLLALGDLLKARDAEIDIPVYQADSILMPARPHDNGVDKNLGFAFEGDLYRLRTSVGEFDIPVFFAEQSRMDKLARVLDDSIHASVSDNAFLKRLEAEADLQREERAEGEAALLKLYRTLRELHDKGLNGVWARIIKNAFAPLFLESCDFVVGNPPWVNWEHLPDQYRRSTMPLWQHYGLFPKREHGMRTILGAAKYDISMLMTYVAADRYLKRGGKLGFVLSQSLFKTAGAGQGFRRFMLPDNTPFGPIAVEDMVELNPFEGATNRTAVAVFAKGRTVNYPVSYQYWRKKGVGRGSAIGFDTPYETVTSDKITFRAWYAEPVDPRDSTSPWLSGGASLLRVLRRLRGPSSYEGRKGVTASANGVFWLDVQGKRGHLVMASNVTERGKIEVKAMNASIEEDLVYPLLRGRDVSRWCSKPELSILLTHEPGMRLKAVPEKEMQYRYPKAWDYLSKFKDTLQRTGIFKRYFKSSAPFYSMFNVGDYTFSRYKVVIREISSSLTCAVANVDKGKAIIPDHKLVIVEAQSADEAHYICAMLNSAIARVFVGAYSISTQFSSHILETLKFPRFDSRDDCHRSLAALSRSAHQAAKGGNLERIRRIESSIDAASATIWKITEVELKDILAFQKEMYSL